MPYNAYTLLILATILLFLGHLVRAARWAILFSPQYFSRRFNLLLGLAIGYMVNTIFPWRLGEILRAFFVSKREAISFSHVAATVVAERLTDLLIIAIAMPAIGYFIDPQNTAMQSLGGQMMLAALGGILFTVLVRSSPAARRVLWSAASIFNDSIRMSIIEFFWSFSEIIGGGKVLSHNYLLPTVLMWLIYGCSYLTYGLAVGEATNETFFALLGTPLQPLITRLANADLSTAIPFLLFSILPVLVVIVYGFSRQWSSIIRALSAQLQYASPLDAQNLISARERFKKDNEYKYFLSSHFSGNDQILSSFGLLAMSDGVMQRLFNGGSEAITALVEVDQQLVIRKFALGLAAKKLHRQADWLKSHQHDNLPIVQVRGERQGNGYYLYDMPFIVPANDFYDVIHTSPIERNQSLLNRIVEQISNFHQRHAAGTANAGIVETYFNEKVLKNTSFIIDFANNQLPGPRYRINDRAYNLTDWNCLTDISWLSRQVLDLRTATIHGDLTIENIIVAPEQPAGFYIIDPNPDNIFNSPLIDLAKLMQSLHLGYEGLHRGRMCTITEEGISLTITRSRAYSDLQEYFEQLIVRQFGADTLREIYFHELVNYLRLTPYKIRKNPSEGLTFFAVTSILLERYLERSI